MPERDVVTWSSLIGCYGRAGWVDEGLGVIGDMCYGGVRPNEACLVNVVGLFTDAGDGSMAKEVHAYVVRNGTYGYFRDTYDAGCMLGTALIDLHSNCGNLGYARRIFDRISSRNVVTWTSMIMGFMRWGSVKDGAELFCKMIEGGVVPTEVTLVNLIIECGFIRAADMGKQVHAYLLKSHVCMPSDVLTALIDMYGKCGGVQYCRELFDHFKKKDASMWTTMVSAYTRARCIDLALECFVQMKAEGLGPTEEAVVCIVSVCSDTTSLESGRWIHAAIEKNGMGDVVLRTALIDMYSKCGNVEASLRVFREDPRRDTCLWNAIITGLGKHGRGKEALAIFTQMDELQVKPDSTTFIAALHSCSHAGLVTEAKKLFHKMMNGYALTPKVEHYGCMVDVLSRACLLDEAVELIRSMPVEPNVIVWGSLLAGAKLYKDSKLEELASKQILMAEPRHYGYNMLVSNIFASNGRWNDLEEARQRVANSRTCREAGLSMVGN
ncbi:hypothetical protein MLD38_023663 [Melastoma candidum]|nr:hypothetical protein MLD38_023663 [Melastoma candidum]